MTNHIKALLPSIKQKLMQQLITIESELQSGDDLDNSNSGNARKMIKLNILLFYKLI